MDPKQNEKSEIKSLRMDELFKSSPAELTSLPQLNSIVEGIVIEKKSNAVFIDLKQWGTGIIYGQEFYDVSDMLKKINVGDPITVKIIDTDNEDGYIELSIKEAGKEMNWKTLHEKMASREIVQARATEANRGGLVVELSGIKGFLPVSQLSVKNYPRVEGGDKNKILIELRKFIGKMMDVIIIDVNPAEEKLIVSEKSIESEAIKKTLENYKIGDIVEGEITGIVDFGAFMKFGENLEGLIHISEIDWRLIEKPSDVLKIGEKIKAQIISIDNNRVTLSLKTLKPNPWTDIDSKYKVGDIVSGEVTKINPFGAFIQLDENIHGLCHISEFGSEKNMIENIEIGKKYDFEISSVDKNEYKLALKPINAKKEKESDSEPEK